MGYALFRNGEGVVLFARGFAVGLILRGCLEMECNGRLWVDYYAFLVYSWRTFHAARIFFGNAGFV